MPQPQSLELNVTFGQGALIQFPGVGHYKVGNVLDESGLLVENGFQSVDRNTVTIIVRDGVNPADAVVLMTAKIEELVASGEIRV
jgi:hypothetical protein